MENLSEEKIKKRNKDLKKKNKKQYQENNSEN